MLPLMTWLAAMNLESTLPPRPPRPRATAAIPGARLVRRTIGRGLIALGQTLAGAEAIGTRTVSVGR